jgi:mitochondrial import receptor subunit TOM20
VELIVIYQKTVPDPVFKIVMEMTSLDVSVPLSAAGLTAGRASAVNEEDGGKSPSSTGRTGPPSEASSLDWENLTDPGARTS